MPTIQFDKERQISRVDVSLAEFSEIYSFDLDPLNDNASYKHVARVRPHYDAPWYGGLGSQKDAETLITEGWPDGLKKIAGMRSDLSLSDLGIKSRRRVGRWSDNGDDLHTDRAMRGEWDQAWRQSRREWTNGPTHIDLVSDWGGSWMLSAEELFWKGAAMVVCADILCDAGYSVRMLAAGLCQAPKGGPMANVITIKDYADPLNLDGVASVLCHAGIFRSFGFRLLLLQPQDVGLYMAMWPGWNTVLSTAKGKGSTMFDDLTTGLLLTDVRDRATASLAVGRALKLIEVGEEKEAP